MARKARKTRRRRGPSRRGGGGAPARCKSALGTCMTSQVRAGKSMKQAGGACMRAFNRCRA